MNSQKLGENLARFLRAGGGGTACAIYLLGGAVEVSVRPGQAGVESPTRVLVPALIGV